MFGLLLLIPALFVWQQLRGKRRGAASLRYSDIRMAKSGHRSWRIVLRPMLTLLRMAAIAAIILGLARPQSIQIA